MPEYAPLGGSHQGPPATWTHAHWVALPTDVGPDRLAAALSELTDGWPRNLRRPVGWRDTTTATGRAASVAAEARRPLAADHAIRVLLLEHCDGADLVLVARRDVLDPAGLGRAGDFLSGRCGRDEVPGPAPAAGSEVPAAPVEVPAPEWAAGDPAAGWRHGVVSLPWPEGVPRDPDLLAAAAGAVLARYDGRPSAPVAVLTPAGAQPGPPERVTVIEVGAGGEPGPTGAGGEPGPLLGIVPPTAATALPFQLPPWPVTLVPRDEALEAHHLLRVVDSGTARRLLAHVLRVAAQLAATRLAGTGRDLTLLDAEETAAVVALGRTVGPPVPPTRLDAAFARRAAEHPHAVAITAEGRDVTYGELADLARRNAAALHTAGVRAGDTVALCLDRSPLLIAAMIGVLTAGAVYVPLDPAYPAQRLARTAEDAGARLVIAEERLASAFAGRTVVDPADLASRKAEPGPAPEPDADAAAYVIYTSGSTGRPKGVVVPHRNVLALLEATRDDLNLSAGDVWTMFHSCAFDFSVWEIWGALLTGGRLVIVPYAVSRSPEEFRRLLADERVTVLNQTPTAFAQLDAADREARTPLALRLVIFGGEPLDTRTLRSWLDRHPESRCQLVNMYGITETTVHTTIHRITRADVLAGSRVVGRPLPGWQLYVLDPQRRPVPPGVAGEIYVGGAGVALHYLGRPELTGERFLTDPYAPAGDGGGRMYRTGDRGRWRTDGALEHWGRLDRQVKIRGFRIELDEIRTVLLDDPAVSDAAVVAGGDAEAEPAGARLHAYVVLRAGSPAEVRRRAARVLPDFMLPATVTELAALPLTVNGKLDAAALPAPRAAAPPPVTTSGTTGALTEIWQGLLGVPVGPHDNFFELGGNSLCAIQVVSAIRDRGLPPVRPQQLYLNPTVSQLAAVMERPDAVGRTAPDNPRTGALT